MPVLPRSDSPCHEELNNTKRIATMIRNRNDMSRGYFGFRSKVARGWATMALILFFAWVLLNGQSAYLAPSGQHVLQGLWVGAAVFLFNAGVIEMIARRDNPRKLD